MNRVATATILHNGHEDATALSSGHSGLPLTGRIPTVTRSGRALTLLLCITAAWNPLQAQATAPASYAVVYNATTQPLRIQRGTLNSTLKAGAGLWSPLVVQIASGGASWTIEDVGSPCSPVGGQGDGGPYGHVFTARSPPGWHQDSCAPNTAFPCVGVGIDDHGLKLVPMSSLYCLLLATSGEFFLETALDEVRGALKTGPRLP